MKEHEFEKRRSDINFWIDNIDSKVSIALGFVGVVLGFVLSSSTIQKYISVLINPNLSITFYQMINIIIYFISLIFLVVALIMFYNSLKATTSSKEFKGSTDNSLIFWGNIAEYDSFDNYKESVKNINHSNKDNDFLSQIYINSIIVKRKSDNYNKGLNKLIIGSLAYVLFEVISLFIWAKLLILEFNKILRWEVKFVKNTIIKVINVEIKIIA